MAADTNESLRRHLTPLPRKIVTIALRYAWVIVAINLTGTAHDFRYYTPQFKLEPVLTWPVVPDRLNGHIVRRLLAGALQTWPVD